MSCGAKIHLIPTVWLKSAGITSLLWSSTWLEMCTSCASSLSVNSVTELPKHHPHPTPAPPCPLTTCPPPPHLPLWPCPSWRCGSDDSSNWWWRCCTATRRCCWTYWRTVVTSLSRWTGWGFILQGQVLSEPVAWPPLSSPSSPWSTPGSNSSHEPRYTLEGYIWGGGLRSESNKINDHFVNEQLLVYCDHILD